jgi:putative membrane-bound dehydrogenase-like protein
MDMAHGLARYTRSLAGLWLIAFGFLGNTSADNPPKRVLFIAGGPSHDYGSHEHYAGCRLLADAIQQSFPEDRVRVEISRGWPTDSQSVANADAIVIYADGGGGHPALPHLAELRGAMERGAGLVCLHYAVEVPKDRGGPEFLEWLGGYFETDWSVNPTWTAEFQQFPAHAVTHGVKPFASYDEWYYHMRFQPQMEGVTPILTAVPPDTTLDRPDGPHSGNPDVRAAVLGRHEPQHVAWAFERPGGGRSFGFTGGHFHWGWGREDQRRLVSNAILWTAGIDPPTNGAVAPALRVEELKSGQDEPIPPDFQPQSIAERFQLQANLLRAVPATIGGVLGIPELQSLVSVCLRAALWNVVADDAAPAADPRDPSAAVAGLDVAEGLEATLVASEPELRSLTNIDIDHRGRIWACEVMNYRGRNGSRPEGDRILIIEDQNGDGQAESTKVYYQGRDIDSAMGICVLGNRVIVSATPNIWVFTDDDGDDVPDRKEALFTKTGQPQHDHSAHSFLFGPDGRLYWNFGNTGQAVHDAQGEVVVDVHGLPIVDNGQPLFGGMPFRCQLDGSGMEVLAHNFRNNYETTVDSFGTLWQSDNDDDGNRGVRINFVMEYGNYGYRDEKTGAGWQSSRIGMEDEIPLRHWHLNDPGVVPNMLQTGAGSPTGIAVYEGRLLPERFWDQVIHCDAGPNVVRAYPATPEGAGYSATMEPILVGTRDNWFRPADVAVAPDGSLFVSDWYDPGVGGHLVGDLDRGRLFRIAPPDRPFQVPEFDFSTPQGAVEALKNPCLSVRYLAWQALAEFGETAEPALRELWQDKNPRYRARALWLLARLPSAKQSIGAALSDPSSDIRITGLRVARQIGWPTSEYVKLVVDDPSPAVRREAAIALRFDTSPDMPKLWAALADHHEAGDRWSLEALGIGSDLRSQECFAAYLDRRADDWNTPAGREIVWRIRAPQAAEYLVRMIEDPEVPLALAERYIRALEFHQEATQADAYKRLLELAGR